MKTILSFLPVLRLTSCVKPKACISADSTTLVVNETLQLQSCSEHTGWEAWDFGDGSTKIGAHVSHRYDRTGTYMVKRTAHFYEDRKKPGTKTITMIVQ